MTHEENRWILPSELYRQVEITGAEGYKLSIGDRVAIFCMEADMCSTDLREALTILDLIVNDPSLAVYDAVDNDFKEKRELGLSFLSKFNPTP